MEDKEREDLENQITDLKKTINAIKINKAVTNSVPLEKKTYWEYIHYKLFDLRKKSDIKEIEKIYMESLNSDGVSGIVVWTEDLLEEIVGIIFKRKRFYVRMKWGKWTIKPIVRNDN